MVSTGALDLPLCECGCGERVQTPGSRFCRGHNQKSARRAVAPATGRWRDCPVCGDSVWVIPSREATWRSCGKEACLAAIRSVSRPDRSVVVTCRGDRCQETARLTPKKLADLTTLEVGPRGPTYLCRRCFQRVVRSDGEWRTCSVSAPGCEGRVWVPRHLTESWRSCANCKAARQRKIDPANPLRRRFLERMREEGSVSIAVFCRRHGLHYEKIRHWLAAEHRKPGQTGRTLPLVHLKALAPALGLSLERALELAGGTAEQTRSRVGAQNIVKAWEPEARRRGGQSRAKTTKGRKRGELYPDSYPKMIATKRATGVLDRLSEAMREQAATPKGQLLAALWGYLRNHPTPTAKELRARAAVVAQAKGHDAGAVYATWATWLRERDRLGKGGRKSEEHRLGVIEQALADWSSVKAGGFTGTKWDYAALEVARVEVDGADTLDDATLRSRGASAEVIRVWHQRNRRRVYQNSA